jgi:hypothetical protein
LIIEKLKNWQCKEGIMNAKSLVTIGGTALVTAALALTFLWPNPVDAGIDGLTTTVTIPKLTENGVELTLTAGRSFGEGEQPEFELKGVNTTAGSKTIAVESYMNAVPGLGTAMPDGSIRSMSRMVPQPRELFRQQHILTLGPHESRKVTVSSGTALPAPSLVSVFLKAAGDGPAGNSRAVRMLSFATSAPQN